ncbi:MAG: hypothetical protein GF313_15365 [Caldithrix sp.]|nr:hypothetical protein [Caldithrix sp.]
MELQLYLLPRPYKQLILAFLFLLTSAVMVGLLYVYHTTAMQSPGIEQHYAGSAAHTENENMDIPEHYPKPLSEMLMTTHNHLFGFAFIFVSLGFIFSMNTIIRGRWKIFLIVEPFLSTFLTFASIWALRYIHPLFSLVTISMAILTYGAYFVMTGVIVYELLFKGNQAYNQL